MDRYRQIYGVEPIFKVLQIAPSGYFLHGARLANCELPCARAKRDAQLMPLIEQVWQSNFSLYGADKVWAQLNRQGTKVAPLYGETIDGPVGTTRCNTRQDHQDNGARPESTMPSGFSESTI